MNKKTAEHKNDPNANFAMYELDRVAKRKAQTVTDEGNAPRDIGGNEIEDRIESNEERYGPEPPDDYWSLRDEGRSYWGGESYAERNI